MRITSTISLIAVAFVLFCCNPSGNKVNELKADSLESSEENKEAFKADLPEIPATIQFSYMGSGNSQSVRKGNDFGLTNATKTLTNITIDQRNKSMQFEVELAGEVKTMYFYWHRKEKEVLNTGGTSKYGIVYIGADDNGGYTEVEFYYTIQNIVESIVYRTNHNTQYLCFLYRINQRNASMYKRPDINKIIGCWFVRHQAFLKCKFNSDFTFQVFDGEDLINRGIFEFDGSQIRLHGNKDEVWHLYEEKKDNSLHLKSKFSDNLLDYVKDQTCN